MALDDKTKITIDTAADADDTNNNKKTHNASAAHDDEASTSTSLDPSNDTPDDESSSDTSIDKLDDQVTSGNVAIDEACDKSCGNTHVDENSDGSDDSTDNKPTEDGTRECSSVEPNDETPNPHVDAFRLPLFDDVKSNPSDDIHADVPLLDSVDDPIISLRDDVHAEYDGVERRSRFPHAAKIAIGAICVIAGVAALVNTVLLFAVVEIHPSVAGGTTVASDARKGIDESGSKVAVSYNVKDALHAFSTDDAEILVWSRNWYSVANGADGEQAKAALAAAGKGSTVSLSDGTVISVDGRYSCKASGTAAGIDIDAVKKLYGDTTDWVAIRYDSSHVLVGKRVADEGNPSVGNQ